ncbi:MAG: hypothetical protein ACTS73_01980 [Arsenophonus sp. NEOnobi-MAG3]
MNNFNLIEIRWHKKSTLQISVKLDITYNPLHEFIGNGAQAVDSYSRLRLSLKACCDNMLNAVLSRGVSNVCRP